MKNPNPLLDGHEQVCLSAMMNGHADLPVSEDDLTSPTNRVILAAIRRLDKNRGLLAVCNELQRRGQLAAVGGRPRLTDISDMPHDPANVEYALSEVLEASRQRQAGKIGEQLHKGAITPDEAQTQLAKLHRRSEVEQSWDDALNESVVTSHELRDLKLTPRRKLLDDWMAEGDCGFIFAPRGVGKTWIALAIAQALSTGGKLGEWQAHAAVKVLYVDGEMPPDLMRDRCDGLQASTANLEFLNHEILFDRTGKTLNITNREVQQAITQRCIASGVKVLILDNLSTLASGMKENDADAWELVNNWLLDLRRRKIAVVIIHHAGRGGQMRGTSRREDNVFWIIALDDMKKNAEDKRGARFVSRFDKPSRNTQNEVPPYEWHFVTETSGEVTIAHKQAQTLDVFLRAIESGINRHDEIAEALKLPGYEVSRMAKKAEDEGWITRPKRGEYCLTQKGRERL
jgi:putative DNA primase/helicase